jgi:hypothetical protein
VKEYGAAEPQTKLARRQYLLILAAQWQGQDGTDETGTVGAADHSEVGEDPHEEGPQSRGGGPTRGGARA